MAKRGYRLSDDEIKQFYRIYFALLTFSNKKHSAVPTIALLDPVKGVYCTKTRQKARRR